ncbi:MAG TPA: hypothetical protein VMR45_06035 [Patescibacteria group bacterium]|nr:hypothetical protein [Patescibacteria group bacterium]
MNRWRQVQPNGDAVLLDPATGNRCNPDVPYEWIRDDPRLAEGYSFLAANGSDINLRVLLCRHEHASDLGNVQKGWFEQQVAKSDAYAFEWLGWPRRDYEKILGLCALGAQSRLAGGLDGFMLRCCTAAANSHKPSFSYDIEITDVPLDVMADKMTDLWHPLRLKDAHAKDPVELQDWTIIQTLFRDWYGVGKFGYELKSTGLLEQKRPLDVFLTTGGAHKDLIRKFKALGVSVKISLAVVPHNRVIEAGNLTQNIATTGVVDALFRKGFFVPSKWREASVDPKDEVRKDEVRPQTKPVVVESAPSLPQPETPQPPRSPSIGDVGRILDGSVDKMPIEAIQRAIESLAGRIEQLQSTITDENRAEVEARIANLEQAQQLLTGSVESIQRSKGLLGNLLGSWGIERS